VVREVNKTFAVNKYEFDLTDEEIAAGVHRRRVGGKWEKIGRHQFEYLLMQGLQPHHRMLDVGCGSLRGGRHFARHLDPGNYFGIDVNESLLRAALQSEIPAEGLQDRLPEQNLRHTDVFDCDFGVQFDFALAQSVFTHLTLNHIRLCLWQVGASMAPDGRFYATVFAFRRHPMDQVEPQVKDPYAYTRADMEWAAGQTGWQAQWLGDWGHPRGQEMVLFTRPA
jgi:SAM-dependent methyltransferase